MDTDTDVVRYIDVLVMTVNQTIADHKAAMEARYAAQGKALDVAVIATDKALTKAEHDLDRRLDAINQRLTRLEQRASNG